MRSRLRHNGRGHSSDRAEHGVERGCEWPGCKEPGGFHAPRSPRDLKSQVWFCLAHVRQYNASWNYYAGMADEEVEADIRRDTVWQRPTWRLGPQGGRLAQGFRITDGFGYFNEGPESERPVAAAQRTPEAEALIVLDLSAPVTQAVVKARYKELVKRHHPDANGGTKASEEKFKEISQAYQTIMASLMT
jgi:hypothetical protein